MDEFIKYGNVEIRLPDENLASFCIFQDLTKLFGVGFQSEAVALLRNELKSHTDLKPKPRIDFESDYADIASRSADTIFLVASVINDLAQKEEKIEVSDTDRQEIFKRLKEWKRPRPAKWVIGDIFSLKLKDNTFMFGQIIGTHLTLQKSRVISILNTTGECLNNKTFKVLFNAELLADIKLANERKSTGDGSLLCLCNAYYGLEPWNVLYKDTYYDEMLQKGIERPQRIILLDKDARNKYRLENFGIDDNNKYPE